MSFHDLVTFLHNFDDQLRGFVDDHGAWTYVLASAVVFAETGIIFLAFLPGDSLLFALGAVSATLSHDNPPTPLLNLWLLLGLLAGAAVVGNTTNYLIGRRVGIAAVRSGRLKFVRQEHIDRTGAFFEKHGGKSVVLSLFVPIIRTITPFIAGAGQMNFARFQVYNVVGAVLWVGACVMAGYEFGNIPVIKDNFFLMILGVVVISLIPITISAINVRRKARLAAKSD